MPQKEKAAEQRRPAPRLYLVAPQDPAGLADRRAATRGAPGVAPGLQRLPAPHGRNRINHAKAIAPTVQSAGAALLLDGFAELAARAGADGSHLNGIEAFQAGLAALKPARIAGCGGLATRHDAMLVAEAGA